MLSLVDHVTVLSVASEGLTVAVIILSSYSSIVIEVLLRVMEVGLITLGVTVTLQVVLL